MSTYPNGKIPSHLLIRRGDFLLTAGTWAKFDVLVAAVFILTGVTLRISTGSTVATRGAGAFRTYLMQVLVKAYWTLRGKSRMAAAPGESSHGGEFKGEDALAIDITNYAEIPRDLFYREGRKAGFQMGYFDGRDGKPYEPWHIIDRDPYRTVGSTAGGNATPIDIPAPEPEEEDDMNKCIIIKNVEGTVEWSIIGATVPGGHRTTRAESTAAAWALLYGDPVPVRTNADYVKARAEAIALNKSWVAQQAAIANA